MYKVSIFVCNIEYKCISYIINLIYEAYSPSRTPIVGRPQLPCTRVSDVQR